jgi:hypothetical protein
VPMECPDHATGGEPMSAAVILDPADALERATSDYLAVSRNADMYATRADYELAEHRAWERLLAAREAVEAQNR